MIDQNSRKVGMAAVTTAKDIHMYFGIIMWCIVLFFLTAILGCDIKPKERPLSLGSFTEISRPSISPDGNEIVFTGCGHKEFSPCTMYRFERDSNKLYRYIPRNNEILYGGRYSPSSNKIVCSFIPLDANNEKIYDETQIAILNQNGSGLRIVTQSKRLKLNPTMSYDEKFIVFSGGSISETGSPLRKQKTRVIGSDLYKVNIKTGEETQLTQLAFFGISETYITPDGKYVVFNGDTPTRLPYTENYDAVKQFQDNYKKQYRGNTIFRYAVDGSEVDKEPIPLFIFNTGAEMPALAKDGSIWFEGRVGQQGWIHYYKRTPDGTLKELPYKMLGKANVRNSIIVLHEMVVTPDGSRIVTLNQDQETEQRYLGVLNTATNVHTNLTVPATAENIVIH